MDMRGIVVENLMSMKAMRAITTFPNLLRAVNLRRSTAESTGSNLRHLRGNSGSSGPRRYVGTAKELLPSLEDAVARSLPQPGIEEMSNRD
jgi:hypothetical protein